MMTLETSKAIGGIGAILLIVSAIAFFAQPFLAFIGVVGIILILFALHGLAGYYNESGIFSNALYSFIATIVGAVLTVAGFVYLFLYTTVFTGITTVIYPDFHGDWSTIPNLTANTNLNPNDLVPFVGTILSVLAITWIFLIIASFFLWRSLKRLSSKSNVGLFSTAAIIMLIGSIIPGIGLVIMWFAFLLIAIAFFQLKPQPEPPQQTAAPILPPSMPTPV